MNLVSDGFQLVAVGGAQFVEFGLERFAIIGFLLGERLVELGEFLLHAVGQGLGGVRGFVHGFLDRFDLRGGATERFAGRVETLDLGVDLGAVFAFFLVHLGNVVGEKWQGAECCPDLDAAGDGDDHAHAQGLGAVFCEDEAGGKNGDSEQNEGYFRQARIHRRCACEIVFVGRR